jgi:acyl-CoA thioesterase-1
MQVNELDHRHRAGSSLARGTGHTRREMDCRRWRSKALAALAGLFLAAAVGAPASACRLAMLGDSLTAGYGVGESDALPARLEVALRQRGVDCAVINAGVSGDTSAGGAARLDWVLGDQPTHLLVELGGNDALRGLPVEQLRTNLDQIITAAQARGVQVMLAGMLAPPNLGRAYGEAFKEIYVDLARQHGISLYPFILDGVVLQSGLMQADGIHPNARGVEVIVERLAPVVGAFLQGG